MSKSQENFFWGVLIGGCIGAMVTLLTTPVSGTKLRENIMTTTNSKKKKPKTTKKALKK